MTHIEILDSRRDASGGDAAMTAAYPRSGL